jgi:hypothetical protein
MPTPDKPASSFAIAAPRAYNSIPALFLLCTDNAFPRVPFHKDILGADSSESCHRLSIDSALTPSGFSNSQERCEHKPPPHAIAVNTAAASATAVHPASWHRATVYTRLLGLSAVPPPLNRFLSGPTGARTRDLLETAINPRSSDRE